MAKNPTTTAETSPDISAVLEQAKQAGVSGTSANSPFAGTRAADLIAQLKTAGAEVAFAGGSLPNLEFSAPGVSHFVRWLDSKTVVDESSKKQNNTFEVLIFDVLNPSTFDAKSKKAEVMGQASLIRAATLEEPFNKLTKGDLLVITYHGKAPAKNGLAPANLYGVDRIG